MASTIITKYGSGAPLASDLVRGELAVDTENGRLYTETSGGAVIEIGTNPTTLAVDTDTLVVDSVNNRVGVGTASPAELLHIESGTNGEQVDIRFRGLTTSAGAGRSANIGFDPDPNDTGTSTEAQLYLSADTTNKTLVATASGDVGIGTSSLVSTAQLTIGGTSRIAPVSGNGLLFASGGSDRMFISTAGNVGIGTASPGVKLDVSGPDGDIARISGSTRSLYFGADSGGLMLGTGASQSGTSIYFSAASDFIYAQTASVERMRIDSSGNLIFKGNDLDLNNGTVLHRITNSGTDLLIRADYNNALANSTIQFSVDGTERMRIDSSGHAIIPAGVTLGTAVGTYNAANTLDDYEEGTWNVVLKDGTGNTYSGTYQSRSGRYTKIGRVVHCTFELYVGAVDLTANGLTSNQGVRIAGFPFNSNSSQFTFGGVSNGNGINYTGGQLYLRMSRNVDEAILATITASTASTDGEVTVTQFNNGNRLVYGTIMYEVV